MKKTLLLLVFCLNASFAFTQIVTFKAFKGNYSNNNRDFSALEKFNAVIQWDKTNNIITLIYNGNKTNFHIAEVDKKYSDTIKEYYYELGGFDDVGNQALIAIIPYTGDLKDIFAIYINRQRNYLGFQCKVFNIEN